VLVVSVGDEIQLYNCAGFFCIIAKITGLQQQDKKARR
jgi:hypothetical protein